MGSIVLPRPKAVWFTYGQPLLLLTAVVAIYVLFLKPNGLDAPFSLMTVPVAITAFYHGFRPAVLVSALGGFVIYYFLGLNWGHIDTLQQLRLGTYFIAAMLICWLGNQRLSSQQKQAQLTAATERRKDDFLAMLGHELRNPLAGISAAARLLAHPGLDTRDMKQNANIIHRQAAHMTHLLRDLLNVSRVTRGQVEIEKAPVELVEVMQTAVEQVRSMVKHREHRLVLNLPVGPVWMLGDKTRLVQVVTNLLINVVRYTPHKGELTLTLSAMQDQARVSVQDNGIGITPEMSGEVFEQFVQVKRSTDGEKGGLGLGLSLVKSMVEAHGGQVSLHSAGLNHGSTFSVTLPLRATASASMTTPQPEPEPEPVTEAKSLDILLVYDNPDGAQPLAMLLRFEGYRVDVAHSGQGALRQAEQRRFDVAILDIGLPDMDGYTLARRFRAIPQQAEARLVAVTGYGTAQDDARAFYAGFDQHIVKPIDCDLLLDELQQVAQRVSPALTT